MRNAAAPSRRDTFTGATILNFPSIEGDEEKSYDTDFILTEAASLPLLPARAFTGLSRRLPGGRGYFGRDEKKSRLCSRDAIASHHPLGEAQGTRLRFHRSL